MPIHTICLDTRDAQHREDGEFTFDLHHVSRHVAKLALGSLEFPMAQWTIEDEWCRIYYSEGIHITPELSQLHVTEHSGKTFSSTVTVQLPLQNNRITRWTRRGRWLRATTEHPHGFWVDGRTSIMPALDWCDVSIVCSPFGTISLSSLAREGKLVYTSATEFKIPDVDGDTAEYGGCIYLQCYPSPAALCRVINYILERSETHSNPRFVYNAERNTASLQPSCVPQHVEQFTLGIVGSKLASLIGYGSSMHERVFRTASDGLASDQFGIWQYVALEPGCYVPSHRPMCTGHPLHMPRELEKCMNRLYYPLAEQIPSGTATSHFLMFTDPSGTLHSCPVFAGRYSPATLCSLLEQEMTASAQRTVPGIAFTVEYYKDRFSFSCEVRENDKVRAASFGLMFNHPESLDGSRLGFGPHQLEGADTYVSENAVPLSDTAVRNIYKVNEIGHQKRFAIHGVSIPQLTCVIVSCDVDNSEVLLQTYAGQLPFSHGLCTGDVVRVGCAPPSALYTLDTESNSWSTTDVAPCPVPLGWNECALVVPDDSQCIHLRVKFRSNTRLAEYIGTVVSVQCEPHPFNLCFGLPHSVGAAQLGFREGALQWGIDGAVRVDRGRLPPYVSPHVHNLEHPDYVLMYIEPCHKSSLLRHVYGRSSTTPFAKIVLFPMVREERMLPRDADVGSGESLKRLTVRFKNPNGTPYHFHGVDFSLSLNMIEGQL